MSEIRFSSRVSPLQNERLVFSLEATEAKSIQTQRFGFRTDAPKMSNNLPMLSRLQKEKTCKKLMTKSIFFPKFTIYVTQMHHFSMWMIRVGGFCACPSGWWDEEVLSALHQALRGGDYTGIKAAVRIYCASLFIHLTHPFIPPSSHQSIYTSITSSHPSSCPWYWPCHCWWSVLGVTLLNLFSGQTEWSLSVLLWQKKKSEYSLFKRCFGFNVIHQFKVAHNCSIHIREVFICI